ncbi:MAG: hypothetical protein QY305_06900 [Candidatus Brocadiaceae baterium WH-1]|nr:MAG: hypothetical protein QY305_06900 [Candidatus Jettenia sp. AMX2]
MQRPWYRARKIAANKTLHLTVFSLRSKTAGVGVWEEAETRHCTARKHMKSFTSDGFKSEGFLPFVKAWNFRTHVEYDLNVFRE